jgi:hypothetical protein
MPGKPRPNTHSHRRVVILLSAMMVALCAACGGSSGKSAGNATSTSTSNGAFKGVSRADIDRAVHRQAYVGKVNGTDAYIGIDVTPGRSLRAYVCDGKDIVAWFTGALNGASGTLVSTKPSAAHLNVTRRDNAFAGTVEVDGVSRAFTAERAQKPAGLYLVETARSSGDVHGAWIVLSDGTQRGSATIQSKTVTSTLSTDSGQATVGSSTFPVGSGGGTGIDPLKKNIKVKCADLQRKYNDAILHSTDRTATEAQRQASLEAADAALQAAVDAGCVSF